MDGNKKSRPIIFSSPMVKAILDGHKTQTRRIIKNKTALEWLSDEVGFNPSFVAGEGNHLCPYGHPGDILWVRETFALGLCTKSTIAYKATHRPGDLDEGFSEKIKWRPSIHMPKFAARIFLEIKNVRVERLLDISEEDSIQEGIHIVNHWKNQEPFYHDYSYYSNSPLSESGGFFNPIDSFKSLWKLINGVDSWDANPWVWVIEFSRTEKP